MRIILLHLLIYYMSDASSTESSESDNNGTGTNSLEETMLRFALDLSASYSKLNSQVNFLCSPISIAAVLNVLLLASEGNTKRQIQRCLHYSDEDVDEETIHQVYKDLIRSFLESRSDIHTNMANGIFVHKFFTIRDEFKEKTKKYYGAKIFSLDFVKEEISSKQFINKFIEDSTRGKIHQPLVGRIFDKLVILANAVYFNGSWENPFDEKLTYNDKFYSEEKDEANVDYMVGAFQLEYFESYGKGFSMISIPYKGSNISFSMFVVLPLHQTLKQLERELKAEDILEAFDLMDTRMVIVSLPRMKLSCHVDLVSTLAWLNVTDVFVAGRSNLSNMADNIFVGKAFHDINVDVTETGTTFAAATIFSTLKSAAFVFRADRPFLFFIRDNVSKAIILWARILRPYS